MIEKILNILNKYENILILWFAREWKTSYNFVRKHFPNKKLTILDEKQIWEINDENIEILIEKITVDRLRQFDLIIKTPGISFKWMDTEGLNITSQLELLLEVDRQNVIAITGTKGKSTTTTLLYQVIKDQKENTFLLWNIWVPIFEQIENFDENSTLVIECSSHQLQYIKTSPHIAILLNLYPEHLDHYNSLEEYYESKLNIFKYQTEWDFAIVDEQVISVMKQPLWTSVISPNMEEISPLIGGDPALAGEGVAKPIEIWKDVAIQWDFVVLNWKEVYNIHEPRKLLWEHNLTNIMNIFVVCDILKLDFEKAKEVIAEFQPLEHRMELVWTFDWVTYYNDSIATIPVSTINSLKSIQNVNTLILWWMDRWIDYSDLINFVNSSNVENVICLPKTGHDLLPSISKKTYKVENLPQAVEISKQVTRKWSVCLLSPAASSYTFFKNFEERGRIFKELVRK